MKNATDLLTLLSTKLHKWTRNILSSPRPADAAQGWSAIILEGIWNPRLWAPHTVRLMRSSARAEEYSTSKTKVKVQVSYLRLKPSAGALKALYSASVLIWRIRTLLCTVHCEGLCWPYKMSKVLSGPTAQCDRNLAAVWQLVLRVKKREKTLLLSPPSGSVIIV